MDRPQSKGGVMYKSQKGVSLLTVLLFMLVATIAGTATYKWLNSEGFSSESRMLMSEARASSLAGVEALRAWMTYHADDVGSILTQYFSNKKTPISLNSLLKPMAKEGQKFSVTLVGVDAPTTSANYKLKVVSTGYARDSAAVYTETAVLNVAGLYRVLKPVAESKYHLDFHYAYFGGSTSFAGGHGVTSALINGNWGKANGSNPIDLEGDFVVTGNVTLSGDQIKAGGTTCVGGGLDPNNGIWTRDLYVAGKAGTGQNKFIGNIAQDAYFGQDLEIGNIGNPGFSVGRNMYLTGEMKPNLNSFQHSIGGNLCLGNRAYITFGSEAANYDFTVAHNVWMPTSYHNGKEYGLNTNKGISGLHHRILGTTENDTAFIKDAKACAVNVVPGVDNCNDVDVHGTKFKKFYQVKDGDSTKGYAGFTTKAKLPDHLPDNPPFSCGANVKKYCDAIWETKEKAGKSCDNSNYFVEDMLMTGWRKFEAYAEKPAQSGVNDCKEIKHISNTTTDKMNKCYDALINDEEKRKKYLFNDYLVFKLNFDENAAGGVNDDNAPKLDGKFLFIYDDHFGGPNANHGRFPKTESNARVFVYLKKGAAVHINCENDTSTRNYFFFTKGDIKGFLGKCTWAGSVYATASSCAKIPDINGTVTMKYDQSVVDDMAQSGIVCDVKLMNAETCGNPPEPPEPDPEEEDDVNFDHGLYDPEFVATSAQLYVTVESEYRSSDKIVRSDTARPSVLVMPRVVYLTKDAPGKLEDYITTIPRVGAISENGTLSCHGAAAVLNSGKIKEKATDLETDVYTCSYTQRVSHAGLLDTSDFYVVISGDAAAATPMVYFDGDANEFFQVDQPGSGKVDLVVAPSDAKGKFRVAIGMSELPSGWEVRHANGSVVTWQHAADGSKFYVVEKSYSTEETKHPIFTITAGANAAPGTVRFTLQSPVGCIIGGGSVIKAFNRRGTATVTRCSIEQYCEKFGEQCSENPKYRLAADSLEECATSTQWVRADGIGCDVTISNSTWRCDAGVGSANRIKLVEGSFDKTQCVMYNPEAGNYVFSPKADTVYSLCASLKRRHYMLHVDLKNSESSRVNIHITENADTNFAYKRTTSCSSSEGCDFVVYVGQRVRLIPKVSGQDVFSRWKSTGNYFKSEQGPIVPLEFVMGEDRSYTAVFNEKDSHCFFSEFQQTAIWCNADIIDCIDHCQGSQPCTMEDVRYENASWIVINSDGSVAKPEIFSKNYLKRPSDGKIAMMMNTVEAGSEGTYNIQLWTGSSSKLGMNKQNLNSGIILRSNKSGTEYISVNFFGRNLTGLDIGAEHTHARVCYLNKITMTENDAKGNYCETLELRTVNTGLTFAWPYRAPLNLDVTLDGDSLHIVGSYAGTQGIVQASADMDLKTVVRQANYTLNDDEHDRVGLKLGDADFGVYNATWHSKKYGAQCFADPSIYCSFSARYLAGEVPQNESVRPVVGFSSWFMNEGASCVDQITYYYNGCDMPSEKYASTMGAGFFNSMYCGNRIDAEGHVENYFTDDGLRVRDGEDFYFKFEGPHGYKHSYRNGIVRNASVKVNCNSVDGHIYRANCGEFYVGKPHSCVQDEIISGPSYNHGTENFEISLTANSLQGINLRDAKVLFYLVKASGVRVSVRFEDASGTQSDAVNLSDPGVNVVENSEYATRYGFDPEHVKKVILKGSGNYSVDSIVSHCAAALKVVCGENDVLYTGESWRVRATIDPFQYAQKCMVTPMDGAPGQTYFGACNSLGEFLMDDPDFMDRMNSGTDAQQYSFKVAVFDDENANETSKPKSECVASTQEYRPVTLGCYLSGATSVVQGGGVPGVRVDVENCPSEGCVYDLVLSNGTQYIHGSNLSGPTTLDPGMNTSQKLSVGNYSFTMRVYNATKTKEYKTCTTDEFNVVAAIPASASSCEITSNGMFRAFVTSGNTSEVQATLVRTDRQGYVLKSQNFAVNSEEYFELNLGLDTLSAGNYQYVLSLNGDEACSVTYQKNNASQITATCPNTPIANQTAGSSIAVSPTVTGCDGQCSWEVVGGTSGNTGSNYTSGSVSFYDANGSETKDYTFKVSRQVNGQTVSAQCGFKVSFASSTGTESATCGADRDEVLVSEAVKFTVTNIQPASSNVKLEVFVDGTKKYESNSWWTGTNWPTDGSSIVLNTVGTSTFSAKVNGQTACTKTVKVKETAPGQHSINGGAPPADTEVSISMSSCGNGVLQMWGKDATCRVKLDGTTINVGNYADRNVGHGTIKLINVGGCLSDIKCH